MVIDSLNGRVRNGPAVLRILLSVIFTVCSYPRFLMSVPNVTFVDMGNTL